MIATWRAADEMPWKALFHRLFYSAGTYDPEPRRTQKFNARAGRDTPEAR